MAPPPPSVHASAVLVGPRAVLIRGEAGSGKSRLALALIEAGQMGLLRFARLIGDDRVHLEAAHGRLLARPTPALAGLIEVRGLGIRTLPYEPVAVIGLVVDLGAKDAQRLPATIFVEICGVEVPRLAVEAEWNALPMITAALATAAHTAPTL
jgi:HPr kinase/phosphorylase